MALENWPQVNEAKDQLTPEQETYNKALELVNKFGEITGIKEGTIKYNESDWSETRMNVNIENKRVISIPDENWVYPETNFHGPELTITIRNGLDSEENPKPWSETIVNISNSWEMTVNGTSIPSDMVDQVLLKINSEFWEYQNYKEKQKALKAKVSQEVYTKDEAKERAEAENILSKLDF